MLFEKRLKNGVCLVGETMDSVRSVSIGIWINAGSVRESAKESGISHYIEHMVFKGTTTRSARDIAAQMDEIGGNINAFTSKECTCFYAKVLDEHIGMAVDILTDIVTNSVFDPEEMEKEKGVVCEEILMVEDTPEDLANEKMTSLYFQGSPLEKPILGTEDTVRSFTREDILSYMDRYYVPGNIVVSCAGRFDPDKLAEMLEERLVRPAKETDRVGYTLGALSQRGKRFQTVEKDIEQVQLCMAMPGASLTAPDRYALFVLNNVLGGSMSSRLFQQIREERGLAYSVYSYVSSYREEGYFAFYAGTGEKQAVQVMELMYGEIEKLKKEGIPKAEFLRSKQQMKGSYILGQEGTSSRMHALGKAKLLSNESYCQEKTVQMIEAVTLEDVMRVMETTLRPEEASHVFVGRVGAVEQKLRRITGCEG